MATYVSPMPRHRRATYGRWRTELAAGLAAGRPDELARLLNSAALLFAEHRWRAAAVDCLTAQLVLADDGALAPDGDLDAFVNLVRLSMTGEAGGQGTLGFWLDAIDGGGTRADLDWLRRRAGRWREAVVDTLVQDALRAGRAGLPRGGLADAAAHAAPDLPEQSRTLRQEYLARAGAADRIAGGTQVFARVVAPLIEVAADEGRGDGGRAGEAAARACQGLQGLSDHIDGTWWRAVAATAAALPQRSAWLDERIAAFLEHEPLLAELLPAELARRFVDPAGLSNERLAPAELEALHGSILARLSPFAGLPQRAAALAGTWRARLEAPAPARPADGDGA